MEHKKRGLALLLALTLPLLCGCEGMVSERPMEDLSGWTIETGADVPTQDAFAAETQMATLYLLSADGDRLVPVPAEVTMRDGESLAQAALTALLDGAKLGRTDATWPMNGEGKAPTLSVSDGIATVNLPARYRALEPKTLFAVRQAVANTLGSLSGIAYVNVLIGGREEGLDLGATTPVGTLTRIDDLDVQGRYNRLDDQRLSGAGYTRLTTLFFPSADGKMLLPVVRTLAYDAGAAAIDCLYTVLEALGSVSADELIEQHVPEPMGYISEMPEIVRMPETGEQAIEIRFSGELTQALEEQKLTLDARYGFWGLIILMCWQQIGYMMIIYIAGLQNVPGDLLEAAAIDGATGTQALFKVKLPMVMPSITICSFLTLTNSFKLFDQNLSLTGGEPAKASQMLALNIYDTFYQRSGAQWKGIGQAKAVVFFLLVIVIALIQLYFTRRKEVQQ